MQASYRTIRTKSPRFGSLFLDRDVSDTFFLDDRVKVHLARGRAVEDRTGAEAFAERGRDEERVRLALESLRAREAGAFDLRDQKVAIAEYRRTRGTVAHSDGVRQRFRVRQEGSEAEREERRNEECGRCDAAEEHNGERSKEEESW